MNEPRGGWASDIFDGCSCGINYEEEGIPYKDHLEISHVIDKT